MAPNSNTNLRRNPLRRRRGSDTNLPKQQSDLSAQLKQSRNQSLAVQDSKATQSTQAPPATQNSKLTINTSEARNQRVAGVLADQKQQRTIAKHSDSPLEPKQPPATAQKSVASMISLQNSPEIMAGVIATITHGIKKEQLLSLDDKNFGRIFNINKRQTDAVRQSLDAGEYDNIYNQLATYSPNMRDKRLQSVYTPITPTIMEGIEKTRFGIFNINQAINEQFGVQKALPADVVDTYEALSAWQNMSHLQQVEWLTNQGMPGTQKFDSNGKLVMPAAFANQPQYRLKATAIEKIKEEPQDITLIKQEAREDALQARDSLTTKQTAMTAVVAPIVATGATKTPATQQPTSAPSTSETTPSSPTDLIRQDVSIQEAQRLADLATAENALVPEGTVPSQVIQPSAPAIPLSSITAPAPLITPSAPSQGLATTAKPTAPVVAPTVSPSVISPSAISPSTPPTVPSATPPTTPPHGLSAVRATGPATTAIQTPASSPSRSGGVASPTKGGEITKSQPQGETIQRQDGRQGRSPMAQKLRDQVSQSAKNKIQSTKPYQNIQKRFNASKPGQLAGRIRQASPTRRLGGAARETARKTARNLGSQATRAVKAGSQAVANAVKKGVVALGKGIAKLLATNPMVGLIILGIIIIIIIFIFFFNVFNFSSSYNSLVLDSGPAIGGGTDDDCLIIKKTATPNAYSVDDAPFNGWVDVVYDYTISVASHCTSATLNGQCEDIEKIVCSTNEDEEVPVHCPFDKNNPSNHTFLPDRFWDTANGTRDLSPIVCSAIVDAFAAAGIYPGAGSGSLSASYFENSLIIGDSITEGFKSYAKAASSGIFSSTSFLAKESYSPNRTNIKLADDNGTSYDSPSDYVAGKDFDRIFVWMGVNCAIDTESCFNGYSDRVLEIQTAAPNSKIVIALVIPTRAGYSTSPSQVAALNERLRTFASEQGFETINFVPPDMLDSNGALLSQYTSDGVHLNPQGNNMVLEYIESLVGARDNYEFNTGGSSTEDNEATSSSDVSFGQAIAYSVLDLPLYEKKSTAGLTLVKGKTISFQIIDVDVPSGMHFAQNNNLTLGFTGAGASTSGGGNATSDVGAPLSGCLSPDTLSPWDGSKAVGMSNNNNIAVPYYNQASTVLANNMESGWKNTLSQRGCGPTALSMALGAFSSQYSAATSAEFLDQVISNDGNNGSTAYDWSDFEKQAASMGFSNSSGSLRYETFDLGSGADGADAYKEELKKRLSAGQLIIVNVGPGSINTSNRTIYTSGGVGHYIVLGELSGDGVFFLDPGWSQNNCVATLDAMAGEIRNMAWKGFAVWQE